MALVADGSRICDAGRNPLAGIDASFTLTNNAAPIIFAGGVDCAAGDRFRTTLTWFWRRVGGTFAQVAASGEVKFGANTVLTNLLALTNANKKTTRTATSTVGLQEFAGASTATPGEIRDEQSGESQIALSVADAPLSQQYEMMLRCVHDAGTTDVTFAALFTTAAFPPPVRVDYSGFPKPKLRF
jgi:hypothetical protein